MSEWPPRLRGPKRYDPDDDCEHSFEGWGMCPQCELEALTDVWDDDNDD